MRAYVLILISAGLVGCGDSSTTPDMPAAVVDMAMAGGNVDMATGTDGGAGGPSLVVNNTLQWCSVTVTVAGGTAKTFTSASMTFTAPAGSTVNLKADPQPTFMPVKWTGVTTMSGDTATYTMTSAASQTVTACCALSNGTGCP